MKAGHTETTLLDCETFDVFRMAVGDGLGKTYEYNLWSNGKWDRTSDTNKGSWVKKDDLIIINFGDI